MDRGEQVSGVSVPRPDSARRGYGLDESSDRMELTFCTPGTSLQNAEDSEIRFAESNTVIFIGLDSGHIRRQNRENQMNSKVGSEHFVGRNTVRVRRAKRTSVLFCVAERVSRIN